ncbi:unnamed protein product [Paramecium pentaurelia]|uniref:J domain-containing protein n=1 Tax=Paramecium pentaurelia TaxID=43138 RepID=A0A8S1WEW7_9CILI|nr:unnamed protein product [Paramecium pentaurelia]
MSDQEFDPSDFAFLYFAISIIIVAMLPLTYSLIKQPFQSIKLNPKYKKAPATAKKAIEIDIQRNLFYKKKGFYWKLFFWILLVMIFINTYQQLPDPQLMKGFDPYEVLGVKSYTPIDQIKKAYRQLAREYHPDKHPDETQKYSKLFDTITKAYQCLTDPRKIANCKKYGNPDGFTGFQIGIALPEFAVSKDNQGFLLAGLFFIFIMIILITFCTAFSGMGKFDVNGILMSNRKHLAERIAAGKNKSFEECLETISQCEEIDNKDFINTIQCEHAPGILYMSIEICLQILTQLWAHYELKQIRDITDQIIVQIESIPKIIQYNSNLNHPGKPKLDANLKTSEETLTEDDYRNTDLFEIKCNLSGLIDQFIQSQTFPVLKQNQWNILLFYNNMIIGSRQVKEDQESKSVVFRIIPAQFEQKNITEFEFRVVAYADSYQLKLEQKINLKCSLYQEEFKKKSNKQKDE